MIDSHTSAATVATHPIQVAARLTGLSPELIRKWEDRYAAVRPARSPTRRRLYTEADIERLDRLHRLTKEGWRISDIARVADERLVELLAKVREPAPQALSSSASGAHAQTNLRAELFAAIERMDAEKAARVLDRALLELSVPHLLEGLIAPVLTEVGEQWADGRLRCSHEHTITATVRTFLGSLLRTVNASPGGPVLVAGTPAGQAHELGALMVAITAATVGWRAIYLGPGLPASELAYSALNNNARAVALSLTYPGDETLTHTEIETLRQNVPVGCPVLIGGAAARDVSAHMNRPRLFCLDALRALGPMLADLRQKTAT